MPSRKKTRPRPTLPPPPSVAEQGVTIARHYRWAVEVHGEARAGRLMRKLGIKYSELHPSAAQVRAAFIAVKTNRDWQAVLGEWYDPDAEWPTTTRRARPGDLIAGGAK